MIHCDAMVRRFSQALPALALLLLPTVAYAQVGSAPAPAEPSATPPAAVDEEEDDPGFARRKAAPQLDDEEPVPDAVPFTDEDPGMSDQIVVRKPRRPRRHVGFADPLGMSLRVGYRTLTNKQVVFSENREMDTYGDSRFHVLSVDVYPISTVARLGLSVQGGLEPDANDWFTTVGLTVGGQLRGRVATPWIEGGIHTGPAYRNKWYLMQPAPVAELTFLWAFALEAGVDARVGKSGVVGTLAVGVQQTNYYSSHGDADDPLFLVKDSSVTFKLGLGY